MADESILEGVLLEEYERSLRTTEALEDAIAVLPRGYIRESRRGEHVYFYLQRREGKRVVSEYVPRKRVDELKEQIEQRKTYARGLKTQEKSRRQIERALGKKFVDEHMTQ